MDRIGDLSAADLSPRSHRTGRTPRRLVIILSLVAMVSLALSGGAVRAEGESGPRPPDGLAVFPRQEDLGLRVTLTWNHRPDCAGYRVYRAAKADGPYQCVGGVSADTMDAFPFFLDNDAKGGSTYYYRVSALDSTWQEGPQTAPVRAMPQKYRRASGVGKSIIVSLADQRAYFLENDVVVNILRCSTGAGGITPTGSYHIMDHRGTVSGCNYWMDWKPNYGMHSWPSYLGDYEENLGVTARSHGCIRLHPLEAYWPYYWAPDGTPLTIVPQSCGHLPLKGASCSNGATAPSRTWYFAEGYTDSEFIEYLLLFNPGSQPVNAVTTYYPEGHPKVVESYFLQPGSRFTVPVNSVNGLPWCFGHAIEIVGDGPVVAQQTEYFNMQGRRGGSCSLGATSPSRTWYFAEGYTGALFSTYLLLFNTSNKQTKCHVTYYIAGGASYFHDFTMPPKSHGTTLVNALPGCNGKEISIRVDSSQPVVAERAEYYDWTGNPNFVNGGDTVTGVTKPGKTWYLAEGCTGHFFDEYILMLNPTGELATVNVEFYTSNGPFNYQCNVAPFSRGTISVDSIPGLESADTAAVINSDKDIVVERSMYCARDSRRGGSAASGISALSKDWYFAEGFTGGTFDEYLLVLNPGTQPTHVTFLFHLENGADVGASFDIAPKSRFTLHANDIPGVEWTGSAVEVHSIQEPVAVEQAEYFCIPQ